MSLNHRSKPRELRLPGSAAACEMFECDLTAVDQWTRLDSDRLAHSDVGSRDQFAFVGRPMAERMPGWASQQCARDQHSPSFTIELLPDRVFAQALKPCAGSGAVYLAAVDQFGWREWASGSLTKSLRVSRSADGDVGMEASLHVGSRASPSALRDFVAAFSWDVSALHACATGGALCTTEEWARRADRSVGRSTPAIPLRVDRAIGWRTMRSPAGVFCALQPGGGLCESDNVLYAVRPATATLQPIVILPGRRGQWECERLTDVWVSNDATRLFARSLLCEGFLASDKGDWTQVRTNAVTAVAPWAEDGFLLALHDGNVQIVGADRGVSSPINVCRVSGRMSRVATTDQRVVGLVGTTLVGARLDSPMSEANSALWRWSRELEARMSFDQVSDLDIDRWSVSPAVSILGDDLLTVVDSLTGAVRAEFAVSHGRSAKWIDAGVLLVTDDLRSRHATQSRFRLLHVPTGRWSAPRVTDEVSRIAVGVEDVQVGMCDQSLAIWSRADVLQNLRGR